MCNGSDRDGDEAGDFDTVHATNRAFHAILIRILSGNSQTQSKEDTYTLYLYTTYISTDR